MKKRSPFGWMELLLGALLLAAGVLAFVYPVGVLGGISAAYGVGILIVGIADIVFYLRLQRYSGFGPITTLVAGILNILAGILFLVNLRLGALVFAVLFPICLIAHCVARLANLPFVRLFGDRPTYWLLLLTGILGILLGALLLFNPLVSLRLVAYVLGCYLILLGVANIATGLGRLGD